MVGVIEFRPEATKERRSPDKFLVTHVTCNVTSIVTCDVTRQQREDFSKKKRLFLISSHLKFFVGLNLFYFFGNLFVILVVNYIYCF